MPLDVTCDAMGRFEVLGQSLLQDCMFPALVHVPAPASVAGIPDLRAARYFHPLVTKTLWMHVLTCHDTSLGWDARGETHQHRVRSGRGTKGLPPFLHCVLRGRLSSGAPGPTCARIFCFPGRRGPCPAGRRTAPATPGPGCVS